MQTIYSKKKIFYFFLNDAFLFFGHDSLRESAGGALPVSFPLANVSLEGALVGNGNLEVEAGGV